MGAKEGKNFTVEFEKEADGRWIVEIPELPGVLAYGTTKKNALQNVYVIALRTLADSIERGRTPRQVSKLFEYAVARR